VPAGTMRLRCSVCGTTASRGSAGEQCRYGCYEIVPGLLWDAARVKLRITRATLVPHLKKYLRWDELKRLQPRPKPDILRLILDGPGIDTGPKWDELQARRELLREYGGGVGPLGTTVCRKITNFNVILRTSRVHYAQIGYAVAVCGGWATAHTDFSGSFSVVDVAGCPSLFMRLGCFADL
jgi:hypothetical protein